MKHTLSSQSQGYLTDQSVICPALPHTITSFLKQNKWGLYNVVGVKIPHYLLSKHRKGQIPSCFVLRAVSRLVLHTLEETA